MSVGGVEVDEIAFGVSGHDCEQLRRDQIDGVCDQHAVRCRSRPVQRLWDERAAFHHRDADVLFSAAHGDVDHCVAAFDGGRVKRVQAQHARCVGWGDGSGGCSGLNFIFVLHPDRRRRRVVDAPERCRELQIVRVAVSQVQRQCRAAVEAQIFGDRGQSEPELAQRRVHRVRVLGCSRPRFLLVRVLPCQVAGPPVHFHSSSIPTPG